MVKPDEPPEINYLAKDFVGFRQLLLDHLSLWLPGWQEEHPADLGHTLVDVLAYAADYLSYYQDAVATEAYLGTARLRRSVKRHARLLDYAWHEGCNARVWVQVEVKADGTDLPKGTQLFTRLDHEGVQKVISPGSQAYDLALAQAPVIFETMMDSQLYGAHNRIEFDTPPDRQALDGQEWGNEWGTSLEQRGRQLWLNKGAVCAVLRGLPGEELKLQVGQVLVLKAEKDAKTGRQADPANRHPVRLTSVTSLPLNKVKIEWGAGDALPFALCLAACYDGIHMTGTSAVLGNIVLTDHGQTIKDEELPVLPGSGRYYPHLRHRNLTFSEPFPIEKTAIWSAKELLIQEPRRALPWIKLYELGSEPLGGNSRALLPLVEFRGSTYPAKQWVVRSELISSGKFERDFAVEIEDDERAYLRFGYRSSGWEPEDAGAPFLATYRIGNGPAGNVARDTIAHIVTDVEGVIGVQNPMPALGGVDPVRTEEARRHAPQAYRSIRPCVTPLDYAEAAKQHPQVVGAAAQFHRIESQRAIFVHVQRHDDLPVDEEFRREVAGFLNAFRMAGVVVEVCEPHYIPFDMVLNVYLQAGRPEGSAREALCQALFRDGSPPDGEAGLLHPGHWTFGQTVYQSQVIHRVMAVPGIARVEIDTFRRRGVDDNEDPIPVGPLEIIRLQGNIRDPFQEIIRFC